MGNDLKKYWSEDFKNKVNAIRKTCIIRIIMCAFIIACYFCMRSAFLMILAIIFGVVAAIHIIVLIAVLISPDTLLNDVKRKSRKKNR